MKKPLLMPLLLLISALSGTHASAMPNGELAQFFQNMEGHWDGKGALQELDANGYRKSTGFRVQLQVDRSSDEGRWDTTSQFELDTEVTAQNNVSYQVRGGELYVSANSQVEPVLVTESTPLKLTYFMRRAEVLTGRVYDFTFSYSLSSPLDHSQVFTSHNVVQINGVVISDESSTASRW